MVDKSIDQINAEHALAKRREIRRSTRTTRKAETAAAEKFIDEAVAEVKGATPPPVPQLDPEAPSEAPKSTRKAKTYTFDAEALRHAREDGSGRSWADVAKILGLPNPGAARKAWADLMGQPHTQAKQIVTRAKRGSGESSRLATPKWDAASDPQTIVDTLLGAKITVTSRYGATETLQVAKVLKFDNTDPEAPAVEIVEGVYGRDSKTGERIMLPKVSTGHTRTIALSRIVEVR